MPAARSFALLAAMALAIRFRLRLWSLSVTLTFLNGADYAGRAAFATGFSRYGFHPIAILTIHASMMALL